MAFAERAYYQYTNPDLGTVDRVEIYEEGYGGGVTMLKGPNPNGIDFSHRDITSTQREYLSIFENQIIMGVLNLTFWVTSTAIETLVTDIADAPAKNFKVVWERDSTVVWQGFKHGRVIDFPEKDPTKDPYLVTVQFRDFEILKGVDYPLDDSRQKIITSFVDIFNELGFSEAIKTHTSWQCEGTTVTDDFLNQVYHDTYALREYANDENGYSNDQNISYYDALLRVADPMLVVYQWKGFNIFQISDCKTPTSMKYAVYNSSGTQVTSTTADRSYALTAKISSNNTSYPALKRAIYEFQHQSGSSQFTFDTRSDLTDEEWVDNGNNRGYLSSIDFEGNGDEEIKFSGQYYSAGSSPTKFVIHIGTLALSYTDIFGPIYSFETIANHSGVGGTITGVDIATDELTLSTDNLEVGDPIMFDSTGTLPTPLTNDAVYYVIENNSGDITVSSELLTRSVSTPGTPVDIEDVGTGTISYRNVGIYKDTTEVSENNYRASVSFITQEIPDSASGSLEVILLGGGLAEGIGWYNMNVLIQNPTQLGESIEYRLIQDNDYSESLKLPDSYYGDGPYTYSRSSYRTSTSLADITTGWRRRGDTTYLDYSRLKLNEVLDYQRVRQLKKTFKLNGEAEPDKVGVYESDNYMYVGGRYNGRWQIIGVKVEENTDG